MITITNSIQQLHEKQNSLESQRRQTFSGTFPLDSFLLTCLPDTFKPSPTISLPQNAKALLFSQLNGEQHLEVAFGIPFSHLKFRAETDPHSDISPKPHFPQLNLSSNPFNTQAHKQKQTTINPFTEDPEFQKEN